MPKTFYIETFGCQMNAHDSEKVIGTLKREGFHRLNEYKRMQVRCHGLLLLALASVGLQAQTSVPFATYTLHANELPKSHMGWTNSVEAPTVKTILAPDHALLVLLPQADGQWLLKRLAAWDTANPTEQTLSFAGALPDKNHNIVPGLIVDANGKCLIARITSIVDASSRRGSNANYLHAIVVVVDLANFTVVSRSESDDDNLRWLNTIDNADSHYDNLAGKHCHRASLSDGGRYASYYCYVEHNIDWDGTFNFETSRKYKVLSLPDGKPLLSISSVSLQSGTFATANGHDYLLVLRDNVKLEVYRLF